MLPEGFGPDPGAGITIVLTSRGHDAAYLHQISPGRMAAHAVPAVVCVGLKGSRRATHRIGLGTLKIGPSKRRGAGAPSVSSVQDSLGQL